MRLIASKHLFQLSTAYALCLALSVNVGLALANTSEAGGIFMSGGSSEGGGVYASGGHNESSVYNNGAATEAGNSSMAESDGGGRFNNGSASEGGGFQNSGSFSESGLVAMPYIPPNPHAWSTYEGPKKPAPWGAPTLSSSGGMANAGTEAEASNTQTPAYTYVDPVTDASKYVRYYGK